MSPSKLQPHHPVLSAKGMPNRYWVALYSWPFEGPKVFICKHCGVLYKAEDDKTGYGGQCPVNIPPPEDPPRRGPQRKSDDV